MTTSRGLIASTTVWCLITVSLAHGQFTTVLNIPPDPNIADNSSIGNGTQLNLGDGGSIGSSFNAGQSGVESVDLEVNIFGGTVGANFDAWSRSKINVHGGMIGSSFSANGSDVTITGGEYKSGLVASADSRVTITGGSLGQFLVTNRSEVMISGGYFDSGIVAAGIASIQISGGTFGDRFDVFSGATLTLLGSEFLLDGAPITGLNVDGDRVQVNIPDDSILSGTLKDGTTFLFTDLDADHFRSGSLTLEKSSVPPIGASQISVPADPLPRGLRSGQSLHIGDGGIVGNHFVAVRGSAVELSGGQIGDNFEALGANVTVADGTIGQLFDAFRDTTVTVTGGEIGDLFEAHRGSVVVVSGGKIKRYFSARDGSNVQVSGGTLGDGLLIQSGSQVKMSGNDFRLDGLPVNGLVSSGDSSGVNIPSGSVLSGTLADGTPFAIENRLPTNGNNDKVADGALTLVVAEVPEPQPATINVPADASPPGIRQGQVLTLATGGQLSDHFTAGWGSAIHILHGHVGRDFEAVGAQVTIEGGAIGDSMRAYFGSVVDIKGGSVGNGFQALKGSIVNIAGGVIGQGPIAQGEGGEDDGVTSASGSIVNVIGRQFVVNGVDITNTLTPNIPFQILASPNGTNFSAILADGNPLSLRVGPQPFSISGTLNVILVVPEPSTFFFAAIAVLGLCACRFHARKR